jgi:hypothetical protein
MRAIVFGLLACALVALAACGDEPDAGATDEVIEVTLTDFSFGDVPDEIVAGTRLRVDNTSPSELHELVAVRLADGDDRSVEEIVTSGLDDVLAGGPPAAVLLAAPGGEQIAAVGDGVLAEPGRYLLLCAIPTGADPQEYLEAAATSDGPPQVDGGPPHFVNGMVDDLVVIES